jgi:hypothetical protein
MHGTSDRRCRSSDSIQTLCHHLGDNEDVIVAGEAMNGRLYNNGGAEWQNVPLEYVGGYVQCSWHLGEACEAFTEQIRILHIIVRQIRKRSTNLGLST